MAFSRVAAVVKKYNKQFLIKKRGLLKSYIYIIIIYLYRLRRQKAKKKKASSHVVSNKKHNGVEDCFLDIFLILLLFFLLLKRRHFSIQESYKQSQASTHTHTVIKRK